VIVDCAVYEDGVRRPGRLVLDEALEAGRRPGAFVWIGLYEPTVEEFAAVRKEFDLHDLAVEDAIRAHQRPKIEVYGESLFIVFKTARYDDPTETVVFAEIQVFVGHGFVVSVRHGEASALSEVRKNMEQHPELLRFGPAAVLHAIVDRVVDDYMPVIDGLDNDISEIEAQVFTHDRTNPAQRIYELKREVLDFHRNAKPLAESLRKLASGSVPFCSPDLAEYFRDVEDHLLRVVAEVEDMRDLLSDALNANLAQVSVRQNQDMRSISAWVAIAAVPTVVGAIYGMNFEVMPELESRWGYPAVLAMTFVICVVVYRKFRNAGWI
jgi:magnesium transporter